MLSLVPILNLHVYGSAILNAKSNRKRSFKETFQTGIFVSLSNILHYLPLIILFAVAIPLLIYALSITPKTFVSSVAVLFGAIILLGMTIVIVPAVLSARRYAVISYLKNEDVKDLFKLGESLRIGFSYPYALSGFKDFSHVPHFLIYAIPGAIIALLVHIYIAPVSQLLAFLIYTHLIIHVAILRSFPTWERFAHYPINQIISAEKPSKKATVSYILGVVSVFLWPLFIPQLIGFIIGIQAYKEGSQNRAMAGIIINGVYSLLFVLLGTIFTIIFIHIS